MSNTTTVIDHEVIVVGAGFAGLCTGAKLGEAGIDYRILEASDGLGGTWWANRYPGVAVDVPSATYSFSFAQYPDWSRVYAPGAELVDYAERFAEDFGVREHIQLHATVASATFDDATSTWRVCLEDGTVLKCRHLIGAWGGLTAPNFPQIPGLDGFRGTVMHTAQWRDDHDLRGERVAVIGTGASAVQLVPAVAPEVEHLSVFQRTATWVLPRIDLDISVRLRRAFRRVPAMQRAMRFIAGASAEMIFIRAVTHGAKTPRALKTYEAIGRWWIRHEVVDPALQEALTPRYGFGCKRPTMSNDYLQTFNCDNVELITSPIRKITEAGILTEDGQHHIVDLIVLGTGFKLWEPGGTPPVAVRGSGGVELGAHWHEHRYTAYHGVTVPGFPNLFLTGWGPYGLGGPSYIFMIETNVSHVLRCITEGRRRGAGRIEVRQEAHDGYVREVEERMPNTVFFNNNCGSANSYYFDHRGDAPLFRPSSSVEMWRRSRSYPLDDYRYEAVAAGAGPPAGATRTHRRRPRGPHPGRLVQLIDHYKRKELPMKPAATETSELEGRIQRLIDESDIRQVLARYARAIDSVDMELLRSVYWPGAIDEHGLYNGPIGPFIDGAEDVLLGDVATDHFLGESLIDLEGDIAWVETHVLARHRMPATDDEPLRDLVAFGRYCDRFERRSGEWRIAHRIVVHEPSRIDAVVSGFDYTDTFKVGIRAVGPGLLRPCGELSERVTRP